MSSATRSETTAAPVAAEPERRSAVQARGLPADVLRMQQAAGNHAVALAIARAPARSIQRCGANCSCSSCGGGRHEEELLEEQFGAGLLRSAVANRTA